MMYAKCVGYAAENDPSILDVPTDNREQAVIHQMLKETLAEDDRLPEDREALLRLPPPPPRLPPPPPRLPPPGPRAQISPATNRQMATTNIENGINRFMIRFPSTRRLKLFAQFEVFAFPESSHGLHP